MDNWGAQEREWDVDYLLGHKIWITTRIANSNWWRNPRGCGLFTSANGCGLLDDLEEGQVCG